MRHFDHDYADEIVTRLRPLDPNTKPAWGVMTPNQMIAHLIATVHFSMGRAGKWRGYDTWFSRNFVCPLILHGILSIPKNVKAPPETRAYADSIPAADLEALNAVLEEYLAAVATGDMQPEPHPYFGDIGIDGWSKLHVRHFEHHLRQFHC